MSQLKDRAMALLEQDRINRRDDNGEGKSKKSYFTTALGVGAVCCLFWVSSRIHVSKPHQYLIKTGLGVTELSVSKTTVQWPFQRITYASLNPRTYDFTLHSMSAEKIEFKLPTVFTIGPMDPITTPDGFRLYAKTISEMREEDVRSLIQGIIEGETRGLTAKLTVEEMFSGKDRFNEEVVKKVQEDLAQLGLRIYNANLKELSDYDENNKYFEYRKKRAIETANYESQAQVAVARRDGEIGTEDARRATRIALAGMDQEAKLVENKNQQTVAMSNADLAKVKAEAERISMLAAIEAKMAAQQREAELQKLVDLKRKEQQLEKHRAEHLTKAVVEAEAKERLADAVFYQKSKEAEGVLKLLESQASGLQRVIDSCGGDTRLAQFYLSLNSGLYPELARLNAEAVRGMQPKLTVWNTGENSEANNDTMKPIVKMIQSFAPMLQGLGISENPGDLAAKIVGVSGDKKANADEKKSSSPQQAKRE